MAACSPSPFLCQRIAVHAHCSFALVGKCKMRVSWCRMKMDLRIGLTLLAALCVAATLAQVPQKLRFFGMAEGLSSPSATCLAEDSTGFIWVGTSEGLNRFDGVNFKVYQTDTATGMHADHILSLMHLGGDRLLVGLNVGGLAMFDTKNERFTPFDTLVNVNGLLFDLPVSFLAESDTTVLIGYRATARNAGGIVRAYLRSFRQEIVVEMKEGVERLVYDEVHRVIWSLGEEIVRFDPRDLSVIDTLFSPFKLARNSPYFSDVVFMGDTVAVASRGDGVHLYSRRAEAFIRNDSWVKENRKVSNNRIFRLMEATNNQLWVATGNSGLALWRAQDGMLSFAPVDAARQHHIEDLDFHDLMADSYGNLWAASGVGLVTWSDGEQGVFYKAVDPPEHPRFEGFYVRTVRQNDRLLTFPARQPNGYILDPTTLERKAAFAIDWEEDGWRHYLDPDHVFTASDGTVFCLGFNYVNRLGADEDRFTAWFDFRPIVGSQHTELQCMVLDRFDQLWVGTNDNRVVRLNTKGEITGDWWLLGDTLARDSSNTAIATRGSRNVVISLASDGEGGVLAGSYMGVFHVSDSGVVNVRELCESCDRLNEFNFYYMSAKGRRIALPTRRSGLFLLDLEKRELRNYNRSNGLVSSRVDDVAFDMYGGIWGTGPNGLFSINEGEPARIAHYLGDPGLPYDNLSWHRITATDDGMVYIGMANGITRINPNKLQSQKVPRRVVLHSVRTHNNLTPRADGSIDVNYGDPLEVRFAALGFDRPQSYRYAWRYAGDDTWNEIADPQVGFSSLGEGDFVLEFKAGNRQGEWTDEVLRLTVDVHTPFLNTAAFQWLLVLAFMALVFVIFQITVRRKRERERNAQAFSQRITELELQALRAQMNPHFLFNTLNSIKFFIIRNEPDAAADYLTKFSRLIRLILANSKSERIALSTELEALTLYVELERLRFGKQFAFVLKVDENLEPDYIQVPPLIIQPYVENAIWHGLMHSPYEGRLEVRLRLEDEDLLVEVDDNGIGRAAAASIRSKTATKEKSMGMDITGNRLRLSTDGRSGKVEIVDFTLEKDQRTGTLVRITMPVEL